VQTESTHTPSMQEKPAPQSGVHCGLVSGRHTPCWQVALGQEIPQPPQFDGSLETGMHFSAQHWPGSFGP
jgi:hypothetical protein